MRKLMWIGIVIALAIGGLIILRRMRGRSDGAQAGGGVVATEPAPAQSMRSPGKPLAGTSALAPPLALLPRSATVPAVRTVETKKEETKKGTAGDVVGSLRT